jgi:hypothetical protein
MAWPSTPRIVQGEHALAPGSTRDCS